MKKKKLYWFRRWIAIALSVMLYAGTLSVNVLAAEEQTTTETIEIDSTSEREQEEVVEETQEERDSKEVVDEESIEEDFQKDESLKESTEITDENNDEQRQEQKEPEEAVTESEYSEDITPVDEQADSVAEFSEYEKTADQTENVEDIPAPVETVQEPAQNSAIDDPLRMDVTEATLEISSYSTATTIFFNNSDTETIVSAKSSNSNIISIENQDDYSILVGANKVGKAIVTVNGSEGSICTINITVVFTGTPMSFGKTSLKYTAGESEILYNNSYEDPIETVSSSNSNIVKAYLDYSSLQVVALRPGNAVLTVTSEHGTICKINVSVTSVLGVSAINIYAGERKNLDILCYFDDDYTLSTSNPKIATAGIKYIQVEDEYYIEREVPNQLFINGKSIGKAVISIKGPNNSVCTVQVNVIKPPLNLSTYSLTIDRAKTYTVTSRDSDFASVSSSNTTICTVKKTEARKVQIMPIKAGKAIITIKNNYGITKTVNVTITKRYFRSCVVNLSKPKNQAYGSGIINGTGAPRSKVSVKIGKKNYTTTVNSNGNFVIRKVPYLKIGTVLSLKFTLQGYSATKKIKIVKGSHSVYTPNYTFKNTTSVPVQLKNVHSGDKVKITVNGKNYYRVIKKSYKAITVKVKIKKPEKYGIKMTTRLLNKFNQELAKMTEYVYHGNSVHVGDSKSKVKWLIDWNDPFRKDYYSWGETWYYDWSGEDDISDAALYFNSKGKVTGWWIEG